jgi:hypothetical protein
MPYPLQGEMMPGGPPPGASYAPGEFASYDGSAGCPDGSCGAGGCAPGGFGGSHGGVRSLFGDVLGIIGPYNDGGACAPRWLDISVEGMWLKRDDAGRGQAVTSQGIGGPIILRTSDINFDERPSAKISAWLQFRSGGNLEFTYYGQFNHPGSAQVTDANNGLYSAFSQFGAFPFLGFLEEGGASTQRIEYSSSFDSFELNYRRHYQGAECRYAGSVLWGVRHVDLSEDFTFTSDAPANQASMRYLVGVNNAITGLQTGGDFWITLFPGIRAGMEGKIGVYGNHASQSSVITATTLVDPYTESRGSDGVALVSDASFMATYRLSQKFAFKAAYNLLYMDGVALAGENFNATPPQVFFAGANRQPTINNNGNIFYSGWSGGLEYNW